MSDLRFNSEKKRKRTSKIMCLFAIAAIFFSSVYFKPNQAKAICLDTCSACNPLDYPATKFILDFVEGQVFSPFIESLIGRHLNAEEKFLQNEFFREFVGITMIELAQYLTTTAIYQVEVVGAFFDAKIQLETQRLFFKLQAEAHRDYHPSDDFCWFGTAARSLAASESRARLNMRGLSEFGLQRQLGYASASSAKSGADKQNRWQQFVRTYCDPKDNKWTVPGTGLDIACEHSGGIGAMDEERINKHVDYTALIEEPRTLEMNFDSPAQQDDLEDVLALSSNLYGNTVLSRGLANLDDDEKQARKLYMDLRAVAAKRAVAQNSFNAIVGMKSEGTNGVSGAPSEVGSYIAAIIKELVPSGTSDADIIAIMGENPSYYAQLEALGKKIYQNPDFFANLYDKPANVERKSVAMKGIELMLDRALFESELRQEMLLSVLLANEVRGKRNPINRDFGLEDEE